MSQELAGVTWSTGFPSQYYLLEYDAANDPYGPANTSTTGQPMPAPNSFQFGFTDSQLKGGGLAGLENNTWEVGYACETGDKTVDYWAIQVTFDASGNWTTSSGGGSTGSTTTTAPSTTTTTPGGVSTTTTIDNATTTVPATDTTTSVAADTGTTIATGTGSGASGGGSSSGGSTQLPITGRPIKMELNIAIGLIGAGALLFVLVTPLPSRRFTHSRRRS